MPLCATCNCPVSDEAHYKTAYHAFNLKRRIAELAPLPLEGYERMLAAQAEEKRKAEEEEAETIFICDACHKTFRSEGQFAAHNGSKKHKDTVKALIAERKAKEAAAASGSAESAPPAKGTPSPSPSSSSSSSAAADPSSSSSTNRPSAAGAGPATKELIITTEHCVFCWQKQDGIEGNLRHMRLAHSFFIPDAEYCEDPDGLLEYLHAKVIEGRYCLYCDSNKQYESPEAVRQHMKDSSHCMMRYDDQRHFDEFEDFFNYAGSEDEDEEYEEEGEDDGEDENSDAEESEEGGAAGAARKPDNGVVPVGEAGEAYISGTDLVLPGGKVARHRKLMRYYRQRFRAPDERASVRAVMSRLALEYGGGAGGAGGGGPTRSSRALAAIAAGGYLHKGTRGNNVDTSAQKRVDNYKKRLDLHTGLTNNQIRTKHFRIQVIGAG